MRCGVMPKNPNNGGARRSAMSDRCGRRSEKQHNSFCIRLIRRINMRRLQMVMVAVLLGLGPAGFAAAQNYPARAITMIVPFPAGGATDTLARFLAEKMRGVLGQPVIIENIAGAAGSIGVGRAVRSPADGYTLSIGTSTTHLNMHSNDGLDLLQLLQAANDRRHRRIRETGLPV